MRDGGSSRTRRDDCHLAVALDRCRGPIRSAVLAGGFGLGVGVMAALLGIGGVILEQARAPELAGGGDVVIGGANGKLTNARFVLSGVLGAGPLARRVARQRPHCGPGST